MGTETGAVTMTAGYYLLALMWLLSAPFVWGALARLLRAGIPNWVLRRFFCSILTAGYWFLSLLAVGLGGIVPALSWFIALAFGGIIGLAIAIMRGWTPLKASPPLVTASYPPSSLPPTPAPTPAPDRGDIIRIDTGELVSVDKWRKNWLGRSATKKPVSSSRATSSTAKRRDVRTVVFTGFKQADRSRLEQMAEEAGLSVSKTVGAKLNYLVTGANAGPSKVAKALDLGIEVMDEEEFMELLISLPYL